MTEREARRKLLDVVARQARNDLEGRYVSCVEMILVDDETIVVTAVSLILVVEPDIPLPLLC